MGPKNAPKDTELSFLTNLYALEHVHVRSSTNLYALEHVHVVQI